MSGEIKEFKKKEKKINKTEKVVSEDHSKYLHNSGHAVSTSARGGIIPVKRKNKD